MEPTTYKNRLSYLMIEPLELRRLKSDLVMVFKCLNNEVSLNNVFQLSHTTFTRGHSKKLIKPNFRTNALKHNFFYQSSWRLEPASKHY